MYRVARYRRTKPCRFLRLTDRERDAVCNGCGGKGGWFNPPDYGFRASCDHHDFNYWLGGSEEDRRRADRQFRDAMMRDVRAAPLWRRPWLWGAAWRYYWAVRWFGGQFFLYHGGETEDQRWSRLERVVGASE